MFTTGNSFWNFVYNPLWELCTLVKSQVPGAPTVVACFLWLKCIREVSSNEIHADDWRGKKILIKRPSLTLWILTSQPAYRLGLNTERGPSVHSYHLPRWNVCVDMWKQVKKIFKKWFDRRQNNTPLKEWHRQLCNRVVIGTFADFP